MARYAAARRNLTTGLLLALLAVFGLVHGSSRADGGQTAGRVKTVEIRAVQYVWNLVSARDGAFICQAIVEHEGPPTRDETLLTCHAEIFPGEATATPTAGPDETPEPAEPQLTPTAPEAPFDLEAFLDGAAWYLVSSRELLRTIQIPLPDIIVRASVPEPQVQPAAVIITAFEPAAGERITAIRGRLNGRAFACAGERCRIPVTGNAVVDFWAESSYGDESRRYQARLRETAGRLAIVSTDAAAVFTDACAAIWGTTLYQAPDWAGFPQSPEDLHTSKPYQYLAGRLLTSGAVSAAACPGGGLYAPGSPNPCGLEQAQQAVVDWQNQYDAGIWEAARTIGIPPRLIKTLIEQESQFWPGNSMRAAYEYGLGQLSPLGADVALRWDNDLYAEICSGLLYNCGSVFGRLPGWTQATLRGGLLKRINAECAECPHGLDLNRAHESIPILARTLRANCYQVNHLLKTHQVKPAYEDLWRFTLVSYHSGYRCLDEALYTAGFNKARPDWQGIGPFLKCAGSKTYVDDLWRSLNELDTYRLEIQDAGLAAAQPTFEPASTAAPAPTAAPASTATRAPGVPPAAATVTPAQSMSQVRVIVYVDANGNKLPEPGEMVDDLPVEVRLDNGTILNAVTRSGEAVVDLSGLPVGLNGTVYLEGLFYSQRIRTARDGEIPVIFRLEEPVLPPGLL